MFDKIRNRISQINIFGNMSRRMRILLKSFFITLLAISALVVAGVILWNRTVAPPEPRPLEPFRRPVETNPANNDDYIDNENEEEVEYEYFWPAPERFTDDDRREMFWTFLIIGLNQRMNSNIVMVASYCGITREANLLSIPRDVAVHPTRNGRQLLSSYIAGSGGGRGREGGIRQVQIDVMNVIGFIPDYYVVIDYDSFFTIIDAVGGIDVYVPIRMRYIDPYQDLDIDIQPGMQHMDSATALDFVRFRQANRNSGYPSLPDGDFGRTRNQQAVITEVVNRLLRPASILQIPEFVSIFNESVYTDLTFSEMMYFALELNNVMGTEALTTYTLLPARSGWPATSEEFLSPHTVLEVVNRMINPFYYDIELGDINVVTQ